MHLFTIFSQNEIFVANDGKASWTDKADVLSILTEELREVDGVRVWAIDSDTDGLLRRDKPQARNVTGVFAETLYSQCEFCAVQDPDDITRALGGDKAKMQQLVTAVNAGAKEGLLTMQHARKLLLPVFEGTVLGRLIF